MTNELYYFNSECDETFRKQTFHIQSTTRSIPWLLPKGAIRNGRYRNDIWKLVKR